MTKQGTVATGRGGDMQKCPRLPEKGGRIARNIPLTDHGVLLLVHLSKGVSISNLFLRLTFFVSR